MDMKEFKQIITLIIASFVGAFIAKVLELLLVNPTNIWNWIGFIFALIVIYFLARMMLRSVRNSDKKPKTKEKLSETELKLRIRTEEKLKFWAEYVLVLMLGLFGAYWILPTRLDQIKNYNAYAILISLILTIILFASYNFYSKKTDNYIRNN